MNHIILLPFRKRVIRRYVIVIHWVTRTRNYGSKRTNNEGGARAKDYGEGEVCLRRHNSLATSESIIYLLPEVIQSAGRQSYAFNTSREGTRMF